MLIDRSLTSVGVSNCLVCKLHLSCLPDIFCNGRYQPEGIVRTGVLDSMNNIRLSCTGNHRRRLERFFLFLTVRVKPFGLEQVQPVSPAGQAP